MVRAACGRRRRGVGAAPRTLDEIAADEGWNLYLAPGDYTDANPDTWVQTGAVSDDIEGINTVSRMATSGSPDWSASEATGLYSLTRPWADFGGASSGQDQYLLAVVNLNGITTTANTEADARLIADGAGYTGLYARLDGGTTRVRMYRYDGTYCHAEQAVGDPARVVVQGRYTVADGGIRLKVDGGAWSSVVAAGAITSALNVYASAYVSLGRNYRGRIVAAALHTAPPSGAVADEIAVAGAALP